MDESFLILILNLLQKLYIVQVRDAPYGQTKLIRVRYVEEVYKILSNEDDHTD